MKRLMIILVLMPAIGIMPLFGEKLSIAADAAAFRYDANAAFVEIYYQVQQSWVSETHETPWQVQVSMDIFRNDSLYTQTSWTDSSTLAQSQNSIALSGRAYFLAIAGDYEIQLSAQNANHPDEQDKIVLNRSLAPFVPETSLMSDPELATQIEFATDEQKDHPFYKNSLMVTPNPSGVFGVDYPILYYYYEIYSNEAAIKDTPVTLKAEILNDEKQAVEGVPVLSKIRKISGPALVEMGQIGLFPLSTGHYYLQLSMSYPGQLIDQKLKEFYLFKDPVPNTDDAVSTDGYYQLSPFVNMEKKELENELEIIRYIMTDDEKKVSKGLNSEEGIRRFLFHFWQKRDPDPKTVPNEYYNTYRARIEEANRRFSSIRRDGWKTDRGRVFMIYGPPTDINRYPVTSERIPYEVWTYEDIEGGVDFIFADRSGYKEYELIHSEKQGEVYNPNYQDLLLK